MIRKPLKFEVGQIYEVTCNIPAYGIRNNLTWIDKGDIVVVVDITQPYTRENRSKWQQVFACVSQGEIKYFMNTKLNNVSYCLKLIAGVPGGRDE